MVNITLCLDFNYFCMCAVSNMGVLLIDMAVL